MGIMNSWFVQNPRFGGYSGFFACLPSKKISMIVFNTLNPKNSTDINYSQLVVENIIKEIAPDHLIKDKSK